MEDKETVVAHQLNALGHFKVLNKLGTVFFILFIVTAFRPFSSGMFGIESSLYSRVEPTFLIFLAGCAVVVFISGVSHKAARVVTVLFILVALLAISDLGEEASQVNSLFGSSGTSGFKEGIAILKDGIMSSTNNRSTTSFQFSPSLILMCISFIGIIGCIWSPRYKENKDLISSLTSKDILVKATADIDAPITNETPLTNKVFNTQTESAVTSSMNEKIGALYQKVLVVAKKVDSLFNEATNKVCEKKPTLNSKHVKIALYGAAVLLIWLIL